MDSIPHARCCKCRLEKPVTEFHKGRNPGGVASYCRTCKNKGTPRVMPKLGPRFDLKNERYTTWNVVEWVSNEQRWLCRCDCGRERLLQGYQWRARIGNRTCICQNNVRVHILPPGEAACNSLMSGYIAGAIRRRLPFELTREQFRMLTSMNCAYCGRPLTKSESRTGHAIYIYGH